MAAPLACGAGLACGLLSCTPYWQPTDSEPHAELVAEYPVRIVGVDEHGEGGTYSSVRVAPGRHTIFLVKVGLLDSPDLGFGSGFGLGLGYGYGYGPGYGSGFGPGYYGSSAYRPRTHIAVEVRAGQRCAIADTSPRAYPDVLPRVTCVPPGGGLVGKGGVAARAAASSRPAPPPARGSRAAERDSACLPLDAAACGRTAECVWKDGICAGRP